MNTDVNHTPGAPELSRAVFSGSRMGFKIRARKFISSAGASLAWFGGTFVLTLIALSSLGWVPADLRGAGSRAVASIFESGGDSIVGSRSPSSVTAASGGGASSLKGGTDVSTPGVSVEEPLHVSIPSVGIESIVLNPQSRDVRVLDRALLSGVVHFPGSGNLNEDTNIFLFGHSTRLSEVRNRAFAAFNRLNEVQLGDDIMVDEGTASYRYRVTSVREVSADEALVRFERGEKKLTLSTCTTFGTRENRIVVEADFVEVVPF